VLALNGKSTFTGPILVNSGSLSTAAATTFTSSGLTVGGPTATGSPALVGSGSLNIPTVFAAAGIGGVVGTEQPGGTTAGGTHTFTNTVTYESGAVFAWQVNTLVTTDPGANAVDSGTFDKVIASGAAGSITGGAAVFRIAIAGSAYTDAFWDTNKIWSGIFTGTGTPVSLAAVFATFAGTSVDANGYVAGQGQFTFVGSTLRWTAGAAPANAYDLWSTASTPTTTESPMASNGFSVAMRIRTIPLPYCHLQRETRSTA
jgi:autotransporter-associated beta strand protein